MSGQPPASLLDTLHRAAALLNEGRGQEASPLLHDVLDLHQDQPDALHLLGVAKAQMGLTQDALPLLRKAVALAPDQAPFYLSLNKALRQGQDFAEAEAVCREGLARFPDQTQLTMDLAFCLMRQNRFSEAEDTFRRVILLSEGNSPLKAQALANLGAALQERRRLDEAEKSLRDALALRPNYPQALSNLATVLQLLDKHDEALALYNQALELSPTAPFAWINRGMLLKNMGRLSEGADDLKRAIAIEPSAPEPWRGLIALTNADPASTAEDLSRLHRDFFARFGLAEEKKPARPSASSFDPERQIRLGFVSSDFREHPVARNITPLLAHRDPANCHLTLYSDARALDATSRALQEKADAWVDLSGMSDEAAAQTIQSDQIDVLVILAAHMDENRLLLPQWRPAPLIVSFHDPLTSGQEEVDYLIGDPVLTPPQDAHLFPERLFRLPSYYLHNALTEAPEPGPPPSQTRADEVITFGAFNNPAKVNDAILSLWLETTAQTPGARLFLRYKDAYANQGVQDRVLSLAQTVNLPESQIEFGQGRLDRKSHLSTLGKADIALDSFPFSGSTTSFETLWMGVPVVTLTDWRMVSRWSASLLRRVGRSDCVAQDVTQFKAIAKTLAQDTEGLAQIRQGLRARLAHSPLCDGRLRARQFDRFIRAIWQRHCAAQGSSSGLSSGSS